ncbi:L-amino acid N-acyltransferase YncA [Alkalibacterium subtropicum]|uniref:L-amino acid N-acyltransferase YncA n=1 Tax=Alkalibacterium subtropicum TaxID=753702 RepID=A0A1I1HPB7_9LACT|nr:GNAT family N-acetyltransferase [Alkalibacterium subtropicum]SFC23273.1 L-amino acid N-acyltransferase YncA [Alkalibacterium subtropicum]
MLRDLKGKQFKIRFAEEKDIDLILEMIRELAVYEKMLDEVVATEARLREYVFEKKMVEVIIGEYQDEPVAFALFFPNFSTFLGKPGLYLEDLYIKPEMRGKGFGRKIFTFLANLTRERGYGRLEWVCLDWNEPSICFYKKMGAVPMEDWTTYRMQGTALENLADKYKET